jgi:peroxiredoxin (alkyl hydroperoxide reductase subunit C)
MLTVGDMLPCFNLRAFVSVEPGREIREIAHSDYAGKWLVLFYWPLSFIRDFPPELAEFARRYTDLRERNAEVLGATTDAPYVHLAWRREHPELDSLPYPTLADFRRDLASRLGVLSRREGGSLRATFLIDPEGVIRWASAGDRAVARSVADILRALDALQSTQPSKCFFAGSEGFQQQQQGSPTNLPAPRRASESVAAEG